MKNIFNRITITLVAIIVFGMRLQAQESSACLLLLDKSKVPSTNTSASTNSNLRTAAVTTLPLQLHFIVNKAGSKQDSTNAMAQIAAMNSSFAQINIQFAVCNKINYIYTEDFNLIDFPSAFALGENYNSSGTVDVFYVPGIAGASGLYTNFSNRDGFILITNNLVNTSTLIHEMGHYFNLPHTHDTDFGVELVNGSNCSYTGDGFCDTPADPNLSNFVGSNCTYTSTQKDPAGNVYTPDVSNFMSYASPGCLNRFSPQQYAHMSAYAANNLLGNYTAGCLMKPDFEVSLGQTLNALTKGAQNTVKLVFLNTSNYTSKTTGLTYTLSLVDAFNTVYPLISSSLQQTVGHNYLDTLTVQVLVPASLPDGAYTLKLTVDPANKVAEILENNNVATRRVAIFSNAQASPDLEITGTGDELTLAGSEYSFNYTVKNIGNFDAVQFDYCYFISKDNKISPDDQFNGPFYFSAMEPGKVLTLGQKVLLPNLPNETMYVIAVIDYNDRNIESNENNNLLALKVSLVKGANSLLPDYVLTNFAGGSATVKLSEVKRFKGIVNNTGDADVSNIRIETYYSQDAIFDANDIKTYGRTERMYGMSSGNLTFTAEIPRNVPLGNAYMLIVLDPENQIIEKNENNNITVFPITVIADGEPYLEFITETVDNYDWYYGTPFHVSSLLKNTGAGSVDHYFFSFSLMKDDNYDYYTNTGIELGFSGWNYSTVFSGNTINYDFSETLTPDMVNAGSYYLVVGVQYASVNLSPPRIGHYTFQQKVTVGHTPITTAVDEANKQGKFQLFPNPAFDEVSLQTDVTIEEMNFFNSDGIAVLQVKNPGASVNISALKSGVYFVRCSTGKEVLIRKLVIMN